MAEQILVKIMTWSIDQISEERPLIQALGNLKYDEYQQFSAGMRFTESLVNWLNQFDSVTERTIAYNFIKDHLIFVTSDQINHLIEICFQHLVDPLLTKKASEVMQVPSFYTKRIHENITYKEMKRCSLFLGLSDGARVDQLRRFAGLDNEQVFTSYQIASEKVRDLLQKLEKQLNRKSKFSSVFLIDDFTGSGLSYIRPGNEGKLITFIERIFEATNNDQSRIADLIDKDSFELHVLFYLATRKSLDYLNDGIAKWKQEKGRNFQHTVSAVQVFENSVSDSVANEHAFIDMVSQSKYFDESIMTDSYMKGKIEKPYLGFDQCALPLILNHNTPNNSLPILWFSGDSNVRGLFPRVNRHKE